MIIALSLHFILAICAPFMVKKFGRNSFFILALAPAATTAYVLSHHPAGLVEPVEEVVPWVPQLGLELAFRLDPLAWLFMLIVSGIGTIIILYCSRYFKDSEPGLQRFAGVFIAFSGAMAGLILADDVMLLFIFWELTTIFSYLLIGHYVTKRASRRAAMNALISTTIGGLAMMVGLLMIGHQAQSLRISEILVSPAFANSSGFLITALVLLAIGAATKSALVPGHFWLPGAMAAPTPVSAYLHAAAMVKAGIYLLLRFSPLFHTQEILTMVIVSLGAITMLVGGWRALRQTDIKLLLAYGTVSQLGFMAAIAGVASAEAVFAASLLVLSHALFKAPLFMTVGIIDKSYHTRDLRELGGIYKEVPLVAIFAALSAASMAAVPFFFGFITKEAVFYTFYNAAKGSEPWMWFVLAAVVLGSALTVAYSIRFFWHTFMGKPKGAILYQAPSVSFQLAPITVTALSLLAVVLYQPLDQLGQIIAAEAFTQQQVLLPNPVEPANFGHLALIPESFSLPLLLSLTALGAGIVLAIFHRPFEKFQSIVSPQDKPFGAYLDAERGFRAFMRSIDVVSVFVTAAFQRGSLPVNLGTIFMAFVALLGTVFILEPNFPGNVVLYHHPVEVAVLLFAGLAAIGAARSRRRLRAALLISATGFAAALLFMIYGAADVAATQLFVETMLTVVLVLVLRRLPSHFSIRPLKRDQWIRWSIAVLTAITAVMVTIYAAGGRVLEPLGPELIEAGYTIGKGHNPVNVALVDARVWDTMGEVGVLLVVASGVASLIFVSRRERSIVRLDDLDENLPIWRRREVEHLPSNSLKFYNESEGLEGNRGNIWLRAGTTLAPERRMVILEVITRLTFPLLMMLSIYLLIAGHNLPGGGFAGGLVGGLAITLRYLAGGRVELNEAAPVQAGALLGIGMVLAVLTGVVPLLFGGTIFQSYVWISTLPILGEVELASALVFDIGVYLIVVGLVLDFLRSLGEQIDRHQEAELDVR